MLQGLLCIIFYCIMNLLCLSWFHIRNYYPHVKYLLVLHVRYSALVNRTFFFSTLMNQGLCQWAIFCLACVLVVLIDAPSSVKTSLFLFRRSPHSIREKLILLHTDGIPWFWGMCIMKANFHLHKTWPVNLKRHTDGIPWSLSQQIMINPRISRATTPVFAKW